MQWPFCVDGQHSLHHVPEITQQQHDPFCLRCSQRSCVPFCLCAAPYNDLLCACVLSPCKCRSVPRLRFMISASPCNRPSRKLSRFRHMTHLSQRCKTLFPGVCHSLAQHIRNEGHVCTLDCTCFGSSVTSCTAGV